MQEEKNIHQMWQEDFENVKPRCEKVKSPMDMDKLLKIATVSIVFIQVKASVCMSVCIA